MVRGIATGSASRLATLTSTRTPGLRALVVAVLCLGVLLPAMRATSARGAPSRSVTFKCQSRMELPGIEVLDLQHIGGRAACRVALSFYRWWSRDDHSARFITCHGNSPARAVLNVHSFDGWRLSISASGWFVMARATQSFRQDGQDYPIVCF